MLEIGQALGKPIILICLIFMFINGIMKTINSKKSSWSDVVAVIMSVTSLIFIAWI